MLRNTLFRTYGYRFQEGPLLAMAQIDSIGWDRKSTADYCWNGMQRAETDMYLFQYTLSGTGALAHDGKISELPPGTAFLVEIPGEHCYYLPETSDHWEFIYIMLFGAEAKACWAAAADRLGPVSQFPRDSRLIQTLYAIHQEAAGTRIQDGYQAASHAYAFVMELYRHSSKNLDGLGLSQPIASAVQFVRNAYGEDITLERVAQHAGLSKFHFARLFQKEIGSTPIQYITKVRMEAAVQLLRNTTLPVTEIARQTGFSNANYFGKVFQQRLGATPSQFRTSRNRMPVDHYTFD